MGQQDFVTVSGTHVEHRASGHTELVPGNKPRPLQSWGRGQHSPWSWAVDSPAGAR